MQHIDPDVKLAAQTLENFAKAPSPNRHHPYYNPSPARYAPFPHPPAKKIHISFHDPPPTHHDQEQQHFIKRVSAIPLVNNTMQNIQQYYQSVTNASRVVKYSAETIGKPLVESVQSVVGSLEPLTGAVDRFACSTLDKLESRFPSLTTTAPPTSPIRLQLQESSSCSADTESLLPLTTRPEMEIKKEEKSKSRWSSVVAGVQGNFGAMVISDDVMRALRYCLQWLQYATNHIDHQINLLKQYLHKFFNNDSPTPPLTPSSSSSSSTIIPHEPSIEYITNIKREVVETVRKVVDVIGRYAAVYLPGEARSSVRGFILSLPGRWAAQPSTPTPTPTSTDEYEAAKVMSFGEESSKMLKGVTNVFAQTVDGAMGWRGETDEPLPGVSSTNAGNQDLEMGERGDDDTDVENGGKEKARSDDMQM